MKHYLLLLILLSISSFSTAQTGSVSGRVVDAQSGESLPYTTIAAYQNNQLVTGTTTGDEGRFKLELPYGTYRLVVQFLSYGQETFNNLTLSQADPRVQLGDIKLSPDEETLQAVEVEGKAVEMQLALDKKVFNVADNLAAKGGSVTDVLDNIPSVSVDVEGNVSLRGSDNVRILIDGKPSGLTGPNALRSLPADMIERVEVITNPSARYEAQGMAGILNIILKKNKKEGLNGSFEATVGWPEIYGLGANINIRRKRANFFANLSTRYRENLGGGFNNQLFYTPRTIALEDQTALNYSFLNQDNDRERADWNNSVRLGTDFLIDDENTLTAAFLYRRGPGDNITEVNYSFLDALGSPVLFSRRLEAEEELDEDLEWSLDYRRLFEEKNKLLTGTVQYRLNAEDEYADYKESYFLPSGEPADREVELQRTANNENQQNLLLQFDFVDPILDEKGQWEAGVRSSFRRINTDYDVRTEQGDTYILDENLSNEFEYYEDIVAAYGQVGMKLDPFSYMLGLRAEYSSIDTRLLQPELVSNKREYISLFPSAFATYSFSKLASAQLSYSRRVRRPGFRELNPFFSLSDARNFRSGNANLDPEFTHSLELSYLRNFNKASLTSSLFYRHTDGVIMWYRSLIPNSDATLTQPLNLGTRKDLGLEFVLSADLTPWWVVNQSLNVFRSETDATDVEERLPSAGNLSVDAFGWQARLSSRMKLKKGFNMQQTFFYMAPQDMPQGRRLSMYMVNLGFSKDILDDKATLTLSVDDLLNSRKWRSITSTDDFYAESAFQWRRRTITLNFTYRLNQESRSNRREGRRQQQPGGGEEDMEF